MAKVSQVNRNQMRERLAKRDKSKRAALKAIVMEEDVEFPLPPELLAIR